MTGKKDDPDRSPYKAYLKYSGIAFQVGVIIFIGVYAGLKLDEHLGLENPLFTVAGTLLGLALGLYYMVKQLMN